MKKTEKIDGLVGLFCPECGKNFFPPIPSEWAWRVGARLYCSNKCQRRSEIRNAERRGDGRPVEMLDLNGKPLRVFSDAAVAGALLNVSAKEIRRCCRSKDAIYHGKRWRYKEGETV